MQEGRFERIRVVQGARTITFGRDDVHHFERLAAEGAPEAREIAVFRVDGATGFDGSEPWRAELIIERTAKDQLSFRSIIVWPERFLLAEPGAVAAGSAPQTLASEIWHARTAEIIVLGLMLFVLTITLFFTISSCATLNAIALAGLCFYRSRSSFSA